MQTGDGAAFGQPGDEGLPTPRYLARFWQTSVAMMAVIDDDGFVIVRNPAHQAILEWSDEEIRSVPYWVLVHPDDRHALVEGREKGATYETRLLTRSGEYRHVIVSVDRDEHTLYMIGFDVTARVADRPVERPRVGTWQYDVATHTATWSQGIYDIYGIEPDGGPPSELFVDLIHPEDQRMTRQAIRWSLSSGQPYDCEFRIVHADGSPRWLHAAGRVYLNDDGDPARMLGITQDVTERRTRVPRSRPRPFPGPHGPEAY